MFVPNKNQQNANFCPYPQVALTNQLKNNPDNDEYEFIIMRATNACQSFLGAIL
jgi:hypothetical protein